MQAKWSQVRLPGVQIPENAATGTPGIACHCSNRFPFGKVVNQRKEVFRHGSYRVRDIHTHVNHLTLFGANGAQTPPKRSRREMRINGPISLDDHAE